MDVWYRVPKLGKVVIHTEEICWVPVAVGNSWMTCSVTRAVTK